MDLLEIIKEVQEERGNFKPQVALYIPILTKVNNKDIRIELNNLVKQNKLIWGKTPHTTWFATCLAERDREIIEESSGWTIEYEPKTMKK